MTKRNSSGQEEVTSFEYDPQGNLLKDAKAKYTYDSFNRLQKAEAFSGQVQINRYDAEGLRHEIEENSKLVQFIYSDRELIAETNTNGDLTRYIRGLGLISSDIDKAKTYYHYCSDELGSITHILDEEGKTLNHYEYDAFGNTTISEETVDNRFRYTGEQYDKVPEQYYLRARYYNPIIGRFLQEDSYYNDGLNLYAYCESNPVRYIDPSGYTKVDAHDKLNGDQQALYDIVDETNKKGRASFEEKDIIYECADEYDVDRNQLGLEDQKLLEGPVAETPSSNPSQGGSETVVNTGRGKNKIKPDTNAQGAHSVYKRDPNTGEITNYKTYKPNPQNPSGFDEVIGYDGVGAPHKNPITGEDLLPHIHDKSVPGKVRKPTPDEIPKKPR